MDLWMYMVVSKHIYIYICIPCFEIESSAMAVLKSAWPQDFEVFEHSETWWMVQRYKSPLRYCTVHKMYYDYLYIYIYGPMVQYDGNYKYIYILYNAM